MYTYTYTYMYMYMYMYTYTYTYMYMHMHMHMHTCVVCNNSRRGATFSAQGPVGVRGGVRARECELEECVSCVRVEREGGGGGISMPARRLSLTKTLKL